MRLRLPVLVSAVVLLLSGCASAAVIDVPDSAGSAPASSTSAAAPPATPAASATPTAVAPAALDCDAALPAGTVEDRVGLPRGTATPAVVDGDCTYSIAGNPSAVVVSLTPARLTDTFTGEGDSRGAVSVPLGTAGYWVQGSAATPSEFAVVAGGQELHIVSFVGDQGALIDWAVSVLASVGVDLPVA
ncbi:MULTISPECIES: hypothetical protein [unclassified Rathayibacter]|uniref:hypothetical protein n=1 Tax=unclassified Rathayibacter TaxID=2609250 RepID=UPI0006F2DD3E|nr:MULTISPECIES: hypothetical protein [unclassified Rathayibacter]KQQ05208.1 hypothetical protein ASF42_00890 [Rathayibacter sp. Leaf294]KQS13071.1 hypothetical protein ASG06_00890 [Rathayibacter sp. Leaf185]